jgi:hypothetical protein
MPVTLRTKEAADHIGSSRTTVAMTGRPAQSGLRSTAFAILKASQRKGMQEGRKHHESGSTGILTVG